MILIARLICEQEYDARGDGLTNGGKGGAVKGVSTLLEGLKKKGLIEVHHPPLIRCERFRVHVDDFSAEEELKKEGMIEAHPPPSLRFRAQSPGLGSRV
jgi:hypothetical protein